MAQLKRKTPRTKMRVKEQEGENQGRNGSEDEEDGFQLAMRQTKQLLCYQ